MMLHFPPAHSRIGRWYTNLQHTTLQAALDDIDAQEPWRRFFRSPLTLAELGANVRCRVTRAPPRTVCVASQATSSRRYKLNPSSQLTIRNRRSS
ncbi:hypothetical protein PR003_g30733 [Phytophthora rubi]|uniref:Uncharacterized protein n=1 Tax=Phytophthora rubi TaxID=129364 RepID=A0A6A4BFB4_9STRA|nr:hypothetical protein PR003_g30733 [Phytophthora rubi]